MNTYTKLRSGDWGVKADGTVKSGDSVSVTKKSGETKRETVAKVLWTDGKTSLCAIGSANSASATRGHRGYESGVCPDCEFNQDAGDMRGCPRHRGNPRA